MDSFIAAVDEALCRFQMIRQKDTVLLAVSGGPDSMALARALLCLQPKYRLTLGVAHLNHRLRGASSSEDEQFVRDFAAQVKVPCFTGTEDVRSLAQKTGISVEEAGRNARYAFFTRTARTCGFSKIATGHTRDDTAEQVLMNLIRGTGLKGLTGIPPIRSHTFIRPLIQLPRHRILGFLQRLEQPYCLDRSNLDPVYLRNRVRHHLLPELEKSFNPEIKKSLARLSQILFQEEDYMAIQTDQAFNTCVAAQRKKGLALSIPTVTSLHPALVNRVIRKGIEQVKKDLKRITRTHIQQILKLMNQGYAGKHLDLPDQIRVYKIRDMLYIKKENVNLRTLGRKEKQTRRSVQGKTTRQR